MTRMSNEDTRADFRRMFSWKPFLATGIAIACYAVASRQLGHPDLEPTTRLIWLLVPLVAFAWVVREHVVHHRRLDEFQRTVNARTTEIAWPLTIVWLAMVALLATAFGFPVPIPGPFGLPPDELGGAEVMMVPLLLHMVVFVVMHKRLSGLR